MALPMDEMMTDTMQQAGTCRTRVSDNPATWGPPDAPLDMPCQVLESRSGRFDLGQLLRLILPGQSV